jgi:hypothetical protein
VKPAAPTAEAIQAAQAAQLHAPAKAKIATENTQVKTQLSKPLTSLQTAAPVHHTATAASPGANTATPNVERSPANTPFTGEPAKPHVTEPTEAKPETTYHPQMESPAPQTHHPSPPPPATTYHPEPQGGGGAPPVHTQAPPASHPAPPSSQGNKPAPSNQNKNDSGNQNNPPGH